ncbi:MAG: glycosyltransferase [Patescibacteria group bacterium]|nr:glycosyltransferase [Patescibacteria group bacterium]
MLSFVVPTYFEGKALERTLRGVKSLTIEPFELIVSDGGSKDETLDIARRYADRVCEWHETFRQTIAMARNIGATQAKGEFLVFMDADVVIPDMNTFFQRGLKHFAEDPKLGFLTVQYRIYPEEEHVADKFFFFLNNAAMVVQNNWLHRGASQGDFQMVRKSVFEQVGGYNEKLVATEDMDLALRVSRVARTHCDFSLTMYQSARRIRKMGWLKLLWTWNINYVYYLVRGKVNSSIWEPIR